MKWTVSVIIGAIIVLGLIYIASSKNSNGNTATNNGSTATSVDGSYELDRVAADLGKMKVSDERSAVFMLKNIDTKLINLRDFNTSCSCTDAIVKFGSIISPRFNMMMHMSPSDAAWSADLAPGQTAEIEIIYMPSKMPVYGPVSRYLDFVVGDKKIKLTVSATVE